ncbi:hypothetical protein QQS21_004478 [Conoideocrella luteorostrata]|uniref:Uncharacterized protein n=1 Tax=Conoideocrella luteorostrata TaxID=1105319 RepID=A0AAJ0FZU1_9HYPO|nr:hypothetical protein QQS21_004478 [Conoideocrella luteorostrata]
MGVQTCLGVATAPSIFQTAMCVDGKTRQYGVVTAPSSGASLYTRFAPMFQINHRTADLPSSSTSTAAAASEKPAHSQSRGLSTAVKAAIAAGASLVGIILTVVASLVIIYIRRQRTLKDRAQDASLVSSMEEVHSKNYIELRDVSHAQMPPDHGVATPGRVWDRSRHSI